MLLRPLRGHRALCFVQEQRRKEWWQGMNKTRPELAVAVSGGVFRGE